jgi:hypothetical protein
MRDDLNSVLRDLAQLIHAQQRGIWDHIHTVVLILTLGVLIWYTVETYKLRKVAQGQIIETTKLLREAERQNDVSDHLLEQAQARNEMSVMPILTLGTEPVTGDPIRIVLLNVGLGPAFNISIDRVEWSGRELHIELDRSILRSGEAKELLLHFIQGDRGSLLDYQSVGLWLNADRIPNPLHIKIRCYSVDSKPYVFQCCLRSLVGKLRMIYEGRIADDGETPVASHPERLREAGGVDLGSTKNWKHIRSG